MTSIHERLEVIGNKRTLKQRENDLRHYIITALWISIDIEDDDRCLDSRYDLDDMDPDTLEIMSNELNEFVDKYYPLVTEEDTRTDMEYFVHNFWLNRNGYGAGFWDGGYKNGEKLSEAASEIGTLVLFAGDDKKIYSTI